MVRTVSRHVARGIPKCTYSKLTDEQRVHIKIQVCVLVQSSDNNARSNYLFDRFAKCTKF
jgi:hypothetical protein